MKKYTAYYRVSTQKQGASGLGLDAQKETVKKFIGNNELLGEFVEIESGKNNQRLELQKAIEFANEHQATLIIAKLDRLSRNVSFIFRLRDTKVDFVCCDIPDANTMTIGIFALLAQQERELISERTKAALKAKKAQGYKLGSPQNLTDLSRKRAIEAKKRLAKENPNNSKAFALIQEMRKHNNSYAAIASRLNEYNFRSSKNKKFYPMQVKRILEMFG